MKQSSVSSLSLGDHKHNMREWEQIARDMTAEFGAEFRSAPDFLTAPTRPGEIDPLHFTEFSRAVGFFVDLIF